MKVIINKTCIVKGKVVSPDKDKKPIEVDDQTGAMLIASEKATFVKEAKK